MCQIDYLEYNPVKASGHLHLKILMTLLEIIKYHAAPSVFKSIT